MSCGSNVHLLRGQQTSAIVYKAYKAWNLALAIHKVTKNMLSFFVKDGIRAAISGATIVIRSLTYDTACVVPCNKANFHVIVRIQLDGFANRELSFKEIIYIYISVK